MARIKLISLFVLFLAINATVFSQVQYGGVINAKDNSQVIGAIMRNGFALKTSDSAILAKLNAGVSITNFPGTQAVTGTFWQTTQPVSIASMPSTPVTGTFWQTTQPVSIATAPVLVAGSAVIGKVGIDQTTPGTTNKVSIGTDGTVAINAAIPTGTNTIGSVKLTDGTTVPSVKAASTAAIATDPALVVAISPNNTIPISAASLPLPSTAATSTKQSDGSQKTQIVDGSGNVIGSTLNALNVNITGGSSGNGAASATGSAVPAQAGYTGFNSGGNLVGVSSANPLPVTSAGIPAALGQTTMSASQPVVIASNQSAIPISNAGIPSALGQTTASASQPVVIASDQVVTLVTGAATQTATVNNILTTASGSAATDISLFKSFAVQIISTGTGGTYIFEGSADNTNFVAIPVYNISLSHSPPIVAAITATSSNIIYVGASQFQYLRLRIATTITGGSIRAYSAYSHQPWAPNTISVFQATAGNLNANITQLSQFAGANSASDGFANPNTTDIKEYGMTFNGTTWDRYRGNFNTTTGDAGAKVANGNGATQTNYNARGAVITALLGTISGTFTTFQFQLQWSPDAGTTWINYGPATTNTTTPTSGNTFIFFVYPANISQAAGVTPANLTTGATQQVALNTVLPRTWRVTWVIAGSSPSATITGIYVNYQL